MFRAMLASALHLFFLFLRQCPLSPSSTVDLLFFSSPSLLPSRDFRHTGGSDFQARLEYDKVKKEIFQNKIILGEKMER